MDARRKLALPVEGGVRSLLVSIPSAGYSFSLRVVFNGCAIVGGVFVYAVCTLAGVRLKRL